MATTAMLFSEKLFEGSHDFQENVRRLEDHLGHTCDKTRVSEIMLRNNGAEMRLLPVQGKYVSVAFFYALSGKGAGFNEFGEDELKIFNAFFGDLIGREGHPTLAFMSKPHNASFRVILK